MPKYMRPVAPLMLLLAATPAYGQEGGLLDINEGLMIWTVLIFLIVLAVLYRTAYPAILGAVEAREKHIQELIEAAQRDRAEAQALLEEQKRERESTRAQVHDMLAEGRTAGEHLREEILAEARREQQELIARTQRDIHQEMETALAALRAETVDVAIAAASKLIERNLNEADNRRLVTEYLGSLEIRNGAGVRAGG